MLIRKQLRKSGRKISFWADVANTCNLGRIRNYGCQVFHYAGHADDNHLAFESSVETECGVAEPLEVGDLKNIFEVGGVKTKLVFISSCCSEDSGEAFVAAGVPHVVAVKNGQSIQDQAALQFSFVFYEALINDGGSYTVREAFEIALRTVDASHFNLPKNQGDHFLLLPKDGDHDRRIFDTLPEGDFTDMTRHAPKRPPIERAVSSYRGLVGLQKVVKLVVEPKYACVTITGERGSGKTEMAIQAADYVRERHHFDAIHWVDCSNMLGADAIRSNPTPPPFAEFPGAVDWLDDSGSDLYRLIGIAIGMPVPGPESEMELHRFLFTKPANGEGQPRQSLEVTTGMRCFPQVLLVLDNADALLERGGDARDRLVKLLASLCAMGEGERLKLLVTSEHRLLSETHERFRDGTEVEAKVQPLTPADASKFLRDKLPRNPTKRELGLSGCQLTDEMINSAVQNHPELVDIIKEGHPGTLQRLAPILLDHIGKNGKLKEMAARYRAELRRAPHRPSSSNSFAINMAVMTFFYFFFRPSSRRASPACFSRAERLGPSDMNQGEPSPEPSGMNQGEQRAWDAAVAAGVVDKECLLLWVVATMDASADEGSHDDGQDNDHRGGSRSTKGLEGAQGGRGGEAESRQHHAVVDRVPWEFLKNGLREHLTGKLTAPSTRRRGRLDQDHDESGEEGEGSWYERVVSKHERRVLEDRELEFIRGILKNKQNRLRRENRHWGAAAARGGGGGGDEILVEEYTELALWWAPLMRTLSFVKRDWEATDPVRVHGFVGRVWANTELERRRTGTFLFRFSESKLGALVVSYKARARPKRVAHCLINVRRGGACCFMEAPQKWYPSLRDLVLNMSVLTTLYPDTPKEAAFTDKTPPSAQGQAGAGGGTGAGRASVDSDAEMVVGWEPPSQVLPQSFIERWRTPAERVGRHGGDAEHGESGGEDDAGTVQSEALSPPT